MDWNAWLLQYKEFQRQKWLVDIFISKNILTRVLGTQSKKNKNVDSLTNENFIALPYTLKYGKLELN